MFIFPVERLDGEKNGQEKHLGKKVTRVERVALGPYQFFWDSTRATANAPVGANWCTLFYTIIGVILV
jgi:hypothetical protein